MDQTGDAKHRTAQLFDRASARYELTGVEFFSTFGAELVELAALRPGDRVLDVGCGSGAVALPAAHAVGSSGLVMAIDLADGMVERCRMEAVSRGLDQLEVRTGDAESPQVEPGSFDVVLAGLVLFFLPSPGAALEAYRTALRPGGRVAFSTFGPQDERFGPVFGAAAAHIPAPEGAPDPGPDDEPSAPTTPARAAAQGLFGSDGSITELLAELGYQDVRHHHVHHGISFSSPEQWIEWSWSHGARQLWEAVPAHALDAAQADARRALAALADDSGEVAHHWVLRYTTAISPQESSVSRATGE